MPRSVKPWVGKTDDSRAPNSVRQRCYDRENGICYLCGQPIAATDGFELDHQEALILGGTNAEANLYPVHKACHAAKTKMDVKVKAKIARVRQRHTGARQPARKLQSRNTFPGRKAPAINKTKLPPLPPSRLARMAMEEEVK